MNEINKESFYWDGFLSEENKAEIDTEVLPEYIPIPLLEVTNLENIKTMQQEFNSQVDVAATLNADIDNDADLALAKEAVQNLNAFNRSLEKKRVEFKKPYFEKCKIIDHFFNSMKRKLISHIERICALQKPYLLKLDQKRKEKNEKIQKEIEQFKQDSKTPELIVTYETPQISGLIEKEVWEVADIKKLPDECFSARYKQILKAITPWINAQIRAGNKNIPGIVFKTVKEVKI